VRVIADTNVLLRAIVGDDAKQSRAAIRALEQAESVVVSQHALCELVRVLDRSYGVSRANIADGPKKVSVWTEFKRIEKVVEVNLCTAALSGGLSSYGCLGNHGSDPELVCNFAQSSVPGPDRDGFVEESRGYQVKIRDAESSPVQPA
jgi:hypothetical protein